MIEKLWNALKGAWSRTNDYFMWAQPRAPVPVFGTPAEAGAYLYTRAKYTGDPGRGAVDFYLHPERLQAAILNPALWSRTSADCDDFATWAYASLRQMRDVTPYIMTLMDGSGRFGHHVICVYKQGGPTGMVYGAIDTSGWQPLTNLSEAYICNRWTEMYASLGFKYTRATVTEYPF